LPPHLNRAFIPLRRCLSYGLFPFDVFPAWGSLLLNFPHFRHCLLSVSRTLKAFFHLTPTDPISCQIHPWGFPSRTFFSCRAFFPFRKTYPLKVAPSIASLFFINENSKRLGLSPSIPYDVHKNNPAVHSLLFKALLSAKTRMPHTAVYTL
jgi:hypothetical protein